MEEGDCYLRHRHGVIDFCHRLSVRLSSACTYAYATHVVFLVPLIGPRSAVSGHWRCYAWKRANESSLSKHAFLFSQHIRVYKRRTSAVQPHGSMYTKRELENETLTLMASTYIFKNNHERETVDIDTRYSTDSDVSLPRKKGEA